MNLVVARTVKSLTPRRLAQAVLVVLSTLLAVVTVPVSPASGGEYVPGGTTLWKLSTRPVTILRDGVPIKLRLLVRDYYNPGQEDGSPHDRRLDVRLSSTSDPSGPVRASQLHQFEFSETVFRHRTDLDAARVTVDDPQHGFHADFRYEATRQVPSSCAGGDRATRGVLSGSMRFDTGTGKVGVLTHVPRHATLRQIDGGCGSDISAPCPPSALRVSASSYEDGLDQYWEARVPASGRTAGRLRLLYFYDNGMHVVSARLPWSALQIAQDLSWVKVRALPGSYFGGDASAVATGEEEPNANGNACPDDPQAVTETHRPMEPLAGDLRVKAWVGPRPSVQSTILDTFANRDVNTADGV